jgi:hypothetical protein
MAILIAKIGSVKEFPIDVNKMVMIKFRKFFLFFFFVFGFLFLAFSLVMSRAQNVPGGENNCFDALDNDEDDGINTKDNNPLTGRDCLDYDCHGQSFFNSAKRGANDYFCQKIEGFENKENALSPKNCFDGIDNDLDAYIWDSVKKRYIPNPQPGAGIDCGDSDCLGVQNPSPPYNRCLEKEFVLFQHNLCHNPKGYLATLKDGIDDNGDGFPNCLDKDCKQKFGNCGPCPGREDWTYDACADGLDNDFDGAVDCQDKDCQDQIGRLDGVVYCGAENTLEKCSDGFDNDGDGKIDCLDEDCDRQGSCEFQKETKCSDGFDNDGDGKIDFSDPDCGKIETVNCLKIPSWTEEIFLTKEISLKQTNRFRFNDHYQMEIKSEAVYSSLAITIGKATEETLLFPYDSRKCKISGPGSESIFSFTDPEGKLMQIRNKPGREVKGFDLIIDCFLPYDLEIGKQYSYPIVVDGLKLEDNKEVFESGEQLLTSEVLENIPPKIKKIEVIGLSQGEVKIPYNSSLFLRAFPEDDPSGICGCQFQINNEEKDSPDCLLEYPQLTKDFDQLEIKARAKDGAGNLGEWFSISFKLNVVPIVKTGPILNKLKPFYYPGEEISFSQVVVQTAENSLLNSCRFLVDGEEIGREKFEASNPATCQGTFSTQGLREGKHLLTVEVSDRDNDTVITPPVIFYICQEGDNEPPCDKADFDQDGVPERTFTSLYSPQSSLRLPCDNCPLVSNPDQEDSNANGIGDICEQELFGEERRERENPWRLCEDNNSQCCQNGFGLCGGRGALCCLDNGNNDCPLVNGKHEECLRLVSWLETESGDLYAQKGMKGRRLPPPNKYNATFCLFQTEGGKENFVSQLENQCPTNPLGLKILFSDEALYLFDSEAQRVLSRLDLNGLKAGRYGEVVNLSQSELGPANFPTALNGKIFYYRGDLTIKEPIEFKNGKGKERGGGLILVEGNLTIKADLSYEDTSTEKAKNLASLGFIVLDNPATPEIKEGNIKIEGNVKNLRGAFLAEGKISTGSSRNPLTVQGLMVAKEFVLERVYPSQERGAEQIIYDGRLIFNPPPGMSDWTKTLSPFSEIVP